MDDRNILSNLISTVDSFTVGTIYASTALKKSADTLNEKILADEEICRAFSHLLTRFRIMSHEFCSIIEDFSCLEPPAEPAWIGEKQQKLDMVYSHGSNPWELYLTFPNTNECLDEMNNMLRELMDQNLLKSYKTFPKKGDFVVACVGNNFHRCIVLKYNPKMTRASVLEIDMNEEGFVHLENIYKMPSSVSLIPCQTMKCCLNVDDKHLESLWCKDLEIVFEKCLTDGVLTVDILKKVNTDIYPLFHIRLHVYNDDLEQEISFSSWVNCRVLVHLKDLNGISEDDLMSALGAECWDPFYINSQKLSDKQMLETSDSNRTPLSTKELAQASINENIVTANSETKGSNSLLAGDVDVLDEPDPHLIDESVLKVVNWMKKYTDEDTNISNRNAAAAAATCQVVELQEPSFPKLKKKPKRVDESKISGNAKLPQAAASAQGGDQCEPILNISGPKPKAKASTSTHSHSLVPSTKIASSSSKLSPTAPEFIPSNGNITRG